MTSAAQHIAHIIKRQPAPQPDPAELQAALDQMETERILAHYDATHTYNQALVTQAAVLEKQISQEVREGKQTAQNIVEFQEKYNMAIKQLGKEVALQVME